MTRAKTVQIRLDEIGEYFETLDDPRSDINQKHPFVSVIVIAVMAVLAGADGPTAIARWAALKAEFLMKQLDLPHGVPKKDVFLRVLSALAPAALKLVHLGGAIITIDAMGTQTAIAGQIIDGKADYVMPSLGGFRGCRSRHPRRHRGQCRVGRAAARVCERMERTCSSVSVG